jgi:NAD(P)-dependent dehydrogenase (short-subunit alcohol dehydrogenase family)
LPCDIADNAAVTAAFARIGERFGALHGLINNAATILLHRLDDSTPEEIQRGLNVNFIGAINCIRAAVPLLKATGGGDIINISSDSVETPMPFMSIYGATKAAMETLSDSLRLELRDDGVRVMVLRSGRVSSGGNLGAGWDPERAKAYAAAKARMNHPIVTAAPVRPETMADMLVQMLRLPREASVDLMELRPS